MELEAGPTREVARWGRGLGGSGGGGAWVGWVERDLGVSGRVRGRSGPERAKSSCSWELGVTGCRSRDQGVRELVFRREADWAGRGHRRSSTVGDSTASAALGLGEAAGDAGRVPRSPRAEVRRARAAVALMLAAREASDLQGLLGGGNPNLEFVRGIWRAGCSPRGAGAGACPPP